MPITLPNGAETRLKFMMVITKWYISAFRPNRKTEEASKIYDYAIKMSASTGYTYNKYIYLEIFDVITVPRIYNYNISSAKIFSKYSPPCKTLEDIYTYNNIFGQKQNPSYFLSCSVIYYNHIRRNKIISR